MDSNRKDLEENSQRDASSRASLLNLPSDLHVTLLSYLDFPALEKLRATSTYFRTLPSDTEIKKCREAYVRELHSEEVEEMRRLSHRQCIRASTAGFSNLADDGDEDSFFAYLNCYSCFRSLHYTCFADTQLSRRRTKGHADAWKRFCTECAIKDNKWEPGSLLSFGGQIWLYCRRCHRLKNRPNSQWFRLFDICQSCCEEEGIKDHKQPWAFDWYPAKTMIERMYSREKCRRFQSPEDIWGELLSGAVEVSFEEAFLESNKQPCSLTRN